MTDLKKPLAVFFDWDGTLVSSLAAIHAAINHVQDTLGKPRFDFPEAKRIMAMGTAKEIFTHLHPEQVQKAYDAYYGVVMGMRSKNLAVMDGAKELIEFLRSNGIKTAVVSNMRHDALAEEIANLGWKDYFDTIVGAGEAPRGKPSPDPIYLAAERAGIARHNLKDVWFVGDMDADRKAARAAGCPFLLFSIEEEQQSERDIAYESMVFYDFRKLKGDIGHIVTKS